MWRVNKNNPQIVKNVRLRLVIDGVGMGPMSSGSIQTPINQILTPMLDNNNINRTAANMYQTAAGNSDGNKFDEFNRQ
jgi:hypothetical protein